MEEKENLEEVMITIQQDIKTTIKIKQDITSIKTIMSMILGPSPIMGKFSMVKGKGRQADKANISGNHSFNNKINIPSF